MRTHMSLVSVMCLGLMSVLAWGQEYDDLFDTRQYGSGLIYSFDTEYINNDGVPDFLFGSHNVEGDAHFLISDGSGGFDEQVVTGFTGSTRTAQFARFDPGGPIGIVNLIWESSGVRTLEIYERADNEGQFGFELLSSEGLPHVPNEFKVSDLDQDGRDDLVVLNGLESSVSVMMGLGGGAFSEPISYPSLLNQTGLTIVDVDGDSVLDIVVLYHSAGELGILLGNGDGTFGESETIDYLVAIRAIGFGDLNSDGHADLVIARTRQIRVYLGVGGGAFEFLRAHTIGDDPESILIEDLNGDSNPDVIVTNTGSDTISILYGNFNGSLDFHTQFQSPDQPRYVSADDFNLDGEVDLAVAGSGGMWILQSDGAKGFRTGRAPFGRFNDTQHFVLRDLNNDGMDDLIVPYGGGSNSLGVYMSIGDGAFADPVNSMPTNNESMIVLEDFDKDAIDDLVMADQFSRTITFLPGVGDGTFGPAVVSAGSTRSIRSVFAVHMDADQQLDLVITTSNRMHVMLGVGSGGFVEGEVIEFDGIGGWMHMEDMNGDGMQDFVRAYRDHDDDDHEYKVDVVLGDGLGGLHEPIAHPIPDRAGPVAVADLNADGNPDVLVAQEDEPKLWVRLGVGDGTLIEGGELEHCAFRGDLGGVSRMLVQDIDLDGLDDVLVPIGAHDAIGVFRGLEVEEGASVADRFAECVPYGVGGFTYFIGTGDLDGDRDADVAVLNWIDTDVYTIGTLMNRTDPCVADLNLDGALNFGDISLFLSSRLDINRDGAFNFIDVSEFLVAYRAGCPES
jgi:FG-GAP-like repeat